MTQETKDKIKTAIQATRLKRQSQVCKTYEMKIDESHLNKVEKEQLKMMFVEAKWLYNHILNSEEDIFKYDYKNKNVRVMNKNKEFEDRRINHLVSHYRRDIIVGMRNSVKSLFASKKKGKKVGKLKFISSYDSIELYLYGIGKTHYISGKNRIKIMGIKRPLLVRGLKQIPKNSEFANAKLINKSDGYYIKLITYINKEKGVVIEKPNVGIDMGISTNIMTSDGKSYNTFIEETKRLKKLQRKIAKSQKGSNNRWKLRKLLKKEYQKIDNRKEDAANKCVHDLLSNHNMIVMQDENLKGWQAGWFGKEISHSILGRVKAKLKKSNQVKIIDRHFPSTQICYVCGTINKHGLDERIYKCDNCEHTEDRDIKSAKTLLLEGQVLYKNKIPTEYRNTMSVDNQPLLNYNNDVMVSKLFGRSRKPLTR